MGGGGGSKSGQKMMGEAAKMSAQTGADYLEWAKGQSEISNAWAAEDRERYQTVFAPAENAFVRDAKTWASAGNIRKDVMAARADVRGEAQRAIDQSDRALAASGVNPNSGRFAGIRRAQSIDAGLAAVGAGNNARDKRVMDGMTLRGQAINIGKGFAVNPATSLGMATETMASGARTAIAGYGQQGQLAGQLNEMKMQAGDNSGVWGGIGSLAGLALGGPIGGAIGGAITKRVGGYI